MDASDSDANVKADIQDKEEIPPDQQSDDDSGPGINYWNIMGFQPFFGRNNIEMVELRKQIGYEAATKIQAWWHNVKPKMQDKEGIPPDQQSDSDDKDPKTVVEVEVEVTVKIKSRNKQ